MTPDPPADATLDELVREIGPMPGPLAAGYARQVAVALRDRHERGGCHGHIRPTALHLRPTVTKVGDDGVARRRPAAGAVVVLADPAEVPADATPAGDVAGLGRVLYFLLAGRPPAAPPAPLAAVRPDLPPGFAALVHRLLSDDPPTAADVEHELAGYAPPDEPAAVDPAPGWAADPTGPRRPLARRPRTPGEKARIGLLVGLGLLLNLAAVGLGVAWLTGALDPRPEPVSEPTPPAVKKPDRPAPRAKKAEPPPDPDEPLQ